MQVTEGENLLEPRYQRIVGGGRGYVVDGAGVSRNDGHSVSQILTPAIGGTKKKTVCLNI